MNISYEMHIEHGSGHFSMVPEGFSTGWSFDEIGLVA
jgi:hypothetical protein